MSALPVHVPGSVSLRLSLKRGLARQAIASAARADAKVPEVLAALRTLRPNRKALERALPSLRRMTGVVGAFGAADGTGVTLVLRNPREVVTCAQSREIFAETSLVYTRVRVMAQRSGTHYHLARASFSLDALERFVERSALPLDAPLLAGLDAEATALLLAIVTGGSLEDDGDHLVPGRQSGVWAGSSDRSQLEEDWGLYFDPSDTCMPIFSTRTYLSPDEMRPSIRLKWQDRAAVRAPHEESN